MAGITLLCTPAPSFAAAGQIVSVKGTKKVVALSPRTGMTRVLFRIRRGYIIDLAASGNGGRIAVATALPPQRLPNGRRRVRPERIWVMARDGNDAHVVRTFRSRPNGPVSDIQSIDISRDGRRIALATRDWIKVMPAEGSAARRVRTAGVKPGIGGLYYAGGPEFTPDGQRLLGVFRTLGPRRARRRGIGTVPISGGRVHFIRSGPIETAAARGFSPTVSEDGDWIAFIASVTRQIQGNRYQEAFRHRIFLMRRDGTRLHRLRAHLAREWALSNLDFSPSGHSLVFGAESRGPKDGFEWGVDPAAIGIMPRDGSRLRLLDVEPLQGWTRSPEWVR